MARHADLGALDTDGHVYLHGRADDVNRGGELVHPRRGRGGAAGDPAVVEAVVASTARTTCSARCPWRWSGLNQGDRPHGADDPVGRLGERCARELAAFERRVEIRWSSGSGRAHRQGPAGRGTARGWRPRRRPGDGGRARERSRRDTLPVLEPRRRRSGDDRMTLPSADVGAGADVRVRDRGAHATHDASAGQPRADALVMLLHFTREAFFVLTAFVLMHRHGETHPVRPILAAAVPAGRGALSVDGDLHRVEIGDPDGARLAIVATPHRNTERSFLLNLATGTG